MNLGLLDILTTQAVDKTDLKRKERNGFEPLPKADAEKSFKSHLVDEPAVASFVHDNEPLNKQASIGNVDAENLIDDNEKSPDFALNLNYIDINKLPEGFNKNDLLKILGNIQTLQISGEENSLASQLISKEPNVVGNFVSAQQGNIKNQANNFTNNTLNSLVSLQEAQEAGEEAGATVAVGDILKNFKKSVSSISNEIAQAGLQTSPIDVSPITEPSLSEVPLHLLQPQENIQQINELGILDNLSILDKGGVTKIASDVIEFAKTEAEAPKLIQGDVKSAQVESLLDSGNKQNEANLKPENSPNYPLKTSDVIVAKNVADSGDAQALTQKLQARVDNHNAAINKAENASAFAQGDLSQDGSSNKDSNSNPFKNDSDLFGQTSLGKLTDSLALNGDFTKFQKYMDTVSNNIKDMGALKAVKAEDVLAQIKFGLSSLGTKGDSKISIQLRPKELGNVDVRIEMGHDGKTKVAIMAEKIDTLNLLQKEAGSLKGMLQDALQTQSGDLSFSFHNQGDQKWKEIIQEAFGNSYSKDVDEDVVNGANIYSSSLVATQGLDIRV